MILETQYTAIIKMYLTKYSKLKLHIDTSGKIAETEKEENGKWLKDRNLKNILNKLSINFGTTKNVVITLKQ